MELSNSPAARYARASPPPATSGAASPAPSVPPCAAVLPPAVAPMAVLACMGSAVQSTIRTQPWPVLRISACQCRLPARVGAVLHRVAALCVWTCTWPPPRRPPTQARKQTQPTRSTPAPPPCPHTQTARTYREVLRQCKALALAPLLLLLLLNPRLVGSCPHVRQHLPARAHAVLAALLLLLLHGLVHGAGQGAPPAFAP